MAYRIIDLEQGSPEWHAFRKGKIGASMAADISGIGFRTPLELWEEIVFDRKRPPSGAMRRGTELEPKAREWIRNLSKIDYKPTVMQSLDHPWRIASLDGYSLLGEDLRIIEIKCPGKIDHDTAVEGNIPDHYMPQLQHIMDVAEVESMIYISFDGEEGKVIEVERDEKYCQKLFKAEEKFYQNVLNFVPPDPIDEDWLRFDDPERLEKAERWRELDLLEDEIKNEKEEIERHLTQELPHARCLIGPLRISKITRMGQIDYRKIEALKEIDLEPYRKKPIVYWKVSL